MLSASRPVNRPFMREQLRKKWQRFSEAPAGERFQRHYEARQKNRSSRFQKVLFIGSGLLIMAAGIFFLPAPGPGTVILFVGAGLIAQESLLAARILDWIELRLRKAVSWMHGRWHNASPALKMLLALLAAVFLGALAFGAYEILFSR